MSAKPKTPEETLEAINSLRDSGYTIVGIDEAGRGCIAGPVTAGACLTPLKSWPVDLPHRTTITDSKKLAPFKRDIAFEWIESNCLWAVSHVTSSVIDSQGMSRALGFAWNGAFAALRKEFMPDMTRIVVVVDGNTHNRFTGWAKVLALPKADLLVPEVSAASICAKVLRDRLMVKMSKLYPSYASWAFNKGYGAPTHWDALKKFGPNAQHRITFKGVRDMGPVIDQPVKDYELLLDEISYLLKGSVAKLPSKG